MKSKQIGRERSDSEFARMLEANLAGQQELEPGAHFLARIANLQEGEFAIIQTEAGNGVVDKRELLDADGKLSYNAGEKIDVFFQRASDGEKIFTLLPTGQAKNAVLRSAMEKQIPLIGKIAQKVKGGYEVNVGEALAFCPQSQMSEDPTTVPVLRFLVIELSPRKVVISNRAHRDRLREAQKELLQGSLQVNDIVNGPVASIQDFGVFVDLGGLEALIPVSELAFERVRNPRDIVKVGEEVRAQVMAIDWKEDRITLSRKPLLQNPWQGALPFKEGDIVNGKVQSIKNFGIFIELTQNFTGLVPLGESNVNRGARVEDFYQKGQEVRVMVRQIDRERERISLSIRKVAEADTRKEYEDYMKSSNEPAEENISSFGKQLLESLNKKK